MEGAGARHLGNLCELKRAEVPGNRKHAENESRITHAIGNEGLVSGSRSGMAMEIEANQKIRTKTDALPSDKHQDVVVPEDQREHREHEQVQVAEKAVVAADMSHVAGAVNVNQHPDAGHEQQPYTGER